MLENLCQLAIVFLMGLSQHEQNTRVFCKNYNFVSKYGDIRQKCLNLKNNFFVFYGKLRFGHLHSKACCWGKLSFEELMLLDLLSPNSGGKIQLIKKPFSRIWDAHIFQ